MRWGERLQFVAEAGPGDFIVVPPYVPHQEINADPSQTLECAHGAGPSLAMLGHSLALVGGCGPRRKFLGPHVIANRRKGLGGRF
jgi:hypothetical protein